MKPILITGGSGQLGTALARLAAARGLPHRAVSRPAFDFQAPDTLAACLDATRPSLVINAAAYTAVDAAETDQAAAARANHTGPAALAQLCAQAGIPLIHISTDYVFDGNKGAPYTETDDTCPTGIYGATKRDGETAILATTAQAIILRTAWVYADTGKNFVRTMLNAARKTTTLRVVADQHGSPTAAGDLAAAILHIAGLLQTGWHETYRGIFHATNQGATSWHGFAETIFATAATHGLIRPSVIPIATADWPTPAKRPADSRLDGSKLAQTFGYTLPDWQTPLPAIVRNLLALDSPA